MDLHCAVYLSVDFFKKYCISLYDFLRDVFSYFNNTVYNTCNIQSTRSPTVYAAGKAPGRQQATRRYVLGELRVTRGFPTAQGFGSHVVQGSTVYTHTHTHILTAMKSATRMNTFVLKSPSASDLLEGTLSAYGCCICASALAASRLLPSRLSNRRQDVAETHMEPGLAIPEMVWQHRRHRLPVAWANQSLHL